MADAWAQAEAEVIKTVPGFNSDWERELRFGAQRQAVEAEMTRLRIAKEEDRIARGSVDGIGCMIARIPLSDYLWAISKWGPQCWSDPAFKKSVLKKNPEVRVKYQPSKIMTGYGS